MQRRKMGNGVQSGDLVRIEQPRQISHLAAVDKTMTDRAQYILAQVFQQRIESFCVIAGKALANMLKAKIAACTIGPEQAGLEAGRITINGEYGVRHQDHFHSRISGISSPYCRMYCLCAMSLSCISRLISSAPCRFGTRFATSMTRWKRSRVFSTTMSNGVVVVPSSL